MYLECRVSYVGKIRSTRYTCARVGNWLSWSQDRFSISLPFFRCSSSTFLDRSHCFRHFWFVPGGRCDSVDGSFLIFNVFIYRFSNWKSHTHTLYTYIYTLHYINFKKLTEQFHKCYNGKQYDKTQSYFNLRLINFQCNFFRKVKMIWSRMLLVKKSKPRLTKTNKNASYTHDRELLFTGKTSRVRITQCDNRKIPST